MRRPVPIRAPADTCDACALNPVGVFCWKRFDGRRTLTEIVAELCAECDDVHAQAEQEIAAFTDDLAAQGYIGFEVH